MPLPSLAASLSAVAIVVGLLAGSAEAQASIIQYTYTGVVDYGYDRAGLFGSAEALTGQAFTLVERFDTERNAYRFVGPVSSLQFGGSENGVADSASLTVTIGGVGRSIADLEDYVYSGSDVGKHQDFVKNKNGYEYAGFYVASSLMPADYGTAFTLDARQASFTGNYQFFSATDPALATYASFDVQSLSVSAISAVPLPPGLALFGAALLGLGTLSWLRHVRARRTATSGRTTDMA